MPDINDKLYEAYDTSNRLAGEAAKLEKERDQLKKELYDFRRAFYDLDKEIISRDRSEEPIDPERHKEIWDEIDRLMGDWYPGKEENV